MRNELREAIREYVDEAEYGEFAHDFLDLLVYLRALGLEFDEETELNEIESTYYEFAGE